MSDFDDMKFGELDRIIRGAEAGDEEKQAKLMEYLEYFSKSDSWSQIKELFEDLRKAYEERENSSITIEEDEDGREVISIDITQKKTHTATKDIISANIFSNPEYAIKYDETRLSRKISVKDSKGYEMGIALGLKSTADELMIEEIKKNPLMTLNPFTHIIFDSLADLMLFYGNRTIFTWQELYSNIPSCHGAISPKMLEMIRDEAFPMMRITTAEINNRWEAENGDYVEFKRKAPLLHYEEIEETIMVNGNVTKKGGFRIVETPILLEFAKSRGQLMRVDDFLYHVPDMSNTRENLILKDYIIRRVEGMISNVLLSRYIKIDTVYEFMKISTDRRVTERLRKKISQILKHLKDCGYIRDFEEHRSGNRITGYEILLLKKKNNKRLIEMGS